MKEAIIVIAAGVIRTNKNSSGNSRNSFAQALMRLLSGNVPVTFGKIF